MQLKGWKWLKLVSWFPGCYKQMHTKDLVGKLQRQSIDAFMSPCSKLKHGPVLQYASKNCKTGSTVCGLSAAVRVHLCSPVLFVISGSIPDVRFQWGTTGHNAAVGERPRWQGNGVVLLQLKMMSSYLNWGSTLSSDKSVNRCNQVAPQEIPRFHFRRQFSWQIRTRYFCCWKLFLLIILSKLGRNWAILDVMAPS